MDKAKHRKPQQLHALAVLRPTVPWDTQRLGGISEIDSYPHSAPLSAAERFGSIGRRD
jgi:hypothetical protein